LCGHITPKTIGGASYFLLVVDDFSRYLWVEVQKTKDQALECFKKINLRAELENTTLGCYNQVGVGSRGGRVEGGTVRWTSEHILHNLNMQITFIVGTASGNRDVNHVSM